mmetsp:Transcript_102423/g.192709  ORF Transcript_102423/g.192709 Transcript_102423/m.192709 type:complete len:238 (+) Transcript_102423:1126-1839(+)
MSWWCLTVKHSSSTRRSQLAGTPCCSFCIFCASSDDSKIVSADGGMVCRLELGDRTCGDVWPNMVTVRSSAEAKSKFSDWSLSVTACSLASAQEALNFSISCHLFIRRSGRSGKRPVLWVLACTGAGDTCSCRSEGALTMCRSAGSRKASSEANFGPCPRRRVCPASEPVQGVESALQEAESACLADVVTLRGDVTWDLYQTMGEPGPRVAPTPCLGDPWGLLMSLRSGDFGDVTVA